MNLESAVKYFSPKSPSLSDSPCCTGEKMTGTDVMAAIGMCQAKVGLGMSAFLGKVEVSDNDKEQAVIQLSAIAQTLALKVAAIRKLTPVQRVKVANVLSLFAYSDYCRSAETPGARCQKCHGSGTAVDLSKTELHGKVVTKTCSRCSGRGYSRMPASSAYRAVKSIVGELPESTWRLSYKPLYQRLIGECYSAESVADAMINRLTRDR